MHKEKQILEVPFEFMKLLFLSETNGISYLKISFKQFLI